jgi:hypothetical protein
MQEKINIITDLIDKSGLKLAQKNLAFKIIDKIVADFNILEHNYQNRIKFDYKIKNDFIDYYDRVATLLYLLGIGEMQIFNLKYKYAKWIIENSSDIKSNLNYNSLEKLLSSLELYEIAYNKQPDSLQELKDFLLVPIKIKEENFEAELKAALKQYSKDHIMTEIIQIGWAKDLMGKIKKEK